MYVNALKPIQQGVELIQRTILNIHIKTQEKELKTDVMKIQKPEVIYMAITVLIVKFNNFNFLLT